MQAPLQYMEENCRHVLIEDSGTIGKDIWTAAWQNQQKIMWA